MAIDGMMPLNRKYRTNLEISVIIAIYGFHYLIFWLYLIFFYRPEIARQAAEKESVIDPAIYGPIYDPSDGMKSLALLFLIIGLIILAIGIIFGIIAYINKRKFKVKLTAKERRILALVIIILTILFSFQFAYISSGLPKVPDIAYVELYEANDSSLWIFTVEAILGKDEIELENIDLIVNQANISFNFYNLEEMVSGVTYDGITYIDTNNSQTLNVGDAFTFDKTIFAEKTNIKLIDSENHINIAIEEF